MAAIQDINGNIETGYVVSERIGIDVPLVIGRTGQRSVLKIGSGTSGMIVKSITRNLTYNIIIIVTGVSYVYEEYLGTITITVPTVNTVKALIADFNSANGDPVNTLITIDELTTGSGIVSALAETSTAILPVYQQIVDPVQIVNYYDTTDTESIIINNMLGGSGTHVTNLFLLDTFGTAAADLGAFVALYDLGDWWAACLANIDVIESGYLADYFTNQKRILFLTTDDVNELATVQGRVVYFNTTTAQTLDHGEASWMTKGLVPAPGSSDWAAIKDLQGQTPDITTDITGLLDVRAANGNTYVSQSGNNFMQDGRVNQVGASNTSPVYIADIMFQDWLVLNMETDLNNLRLEKIAQGSKLSYDDPGIQEAVATLASRLQTGAENGGIADVTSKEQASQSYNGEYRYNVTSLTRAQIEENSPDDIVQQILKNLKFWYVKSGTMQKFEFSGLELLTEPAA